MKYVLITCLVTCVVGCGQSPKGNSVSSNENYVPMYAAPQLAGSTRDVGRLARPSTVRAWNPLFIAARISGLPKVTSFPQGLDMNHGWELHVDLRRAVATLRDTRSGYTDTLQFPELMRRSLVQLIANQRLHEIDPDFSPPVQGNQLTYYLNTQFEYGARPLRSNKVVPYPLQNDHSDLARFSRVWTKLMTLVDQIRERNLKATNDSDARMIYLRNATGPFKPAEPGMIELDGRWELTMHLNWGTAVWQDSTTVFRHTFRLLPGHIAVIRKALADNQFRTLPGHIGDSAVTEEYARLIQVDYGRFANTVVEHVPEYFTWGTGSPPRNRFGRVWSTIEVLLKRQQTVLQQLYAATPRQPDQSPVRTP